MKQNNQIAEVKRELVYGITGDKNILSTFNIDHNIKELEKQIHSLMDAAANTTGDKERYYTEIEKVYLQISALRQEREKLNMKIELQEQAEQEIARINLLLENSEISFNEFDETVVRRIIDCIKIVDNEELLIIIKGGFEIREKIYST